MRIAVIDGQGGGIGKAIVEKLRSSFPEGLEVLALGTNALATALMLKAGANEGASGENAIAWNASRVDAIMGTVALLSANAMLGEITPGIAAAIGSSPALKILIPLNKCNVIVAGMVSQPLPNFIDDAVEILKRQIRGDKRV